MSQERFIRELCSRYPDGSEKMENQLRELKRKLDDTEFSDIDEDQYCKLADSVEKYQKQKCVSTEKDCVSYKYKCSLCSKTYSRKGDLTRHVLTHNSTFKCTLCGKKFKRRDYLRKHQKRKHNSVETQLLCCKHCPQTFDDYKSLISHIEAFHSLNNQQHGGRVALTEKVLHESNVSNPLEKRNLLNSNACQKYQTNTKNEDGHIRSALNHTILDKTIHPVQQEKYDLLTFFANKKDDIHNFLRSRLQHNGIKWYISIQVELVKENAEGDVTATSEPHFRSLTYTTLNQETLENHDLNEALQKINKSLEQYLRDSSGWIVRKVLYLIIHTVIYSPLGGSNYMPLPETLKKSNCILNIQNYDQKCFVYSILASLHPVEVAPKMVSHYQKFEYELNLKDIRYPVTLNQIEKFESQNESISVNVFSFEKKDIIPLKITRHRGRLHHINLLLLKNDKGSHYCLIKDLNTFLSRLKSDGHRRYVCQYCLHMFTKQSLLDEHLPYCLIHGAQKVTLPTSDKAFLQFTDYEKQLQVPFVIYADFETLNRPIHTCDAQPNHSHTNPTTLLTPCSFGYKVVCTDPQYTKPTVIYRGSDAVSKLITCLMNEREEIERILSTVQPLSLSYEDQLSFENASNCCICGKSFKVKDQKARHHNHFTGEFIGAAHMNCNLQCKQANFIPVIFHGLRNFDAHCLCQGIGLFKEQEIKCIAQTTERYVSFSLGNLRFLDSFQFLPSSLETLVENLASDGEKAFSHMQNEFPNPNQLSLLLRKGNFPYSYMTTEQTFEEPSLPSKDAFYSDVKQEHISDQDYEHSKQVFDTFDHKNLGDYHDLYLKTDVVLLSDVFETFRKVSMKQYGLDPCHFYTSPGLSWQALLKKTGVVLELLTDIDQVLFIEKGIRGGVSQISNRYKKANNNYLKTFDPSKPTSFLQYLDANNLYGHAMMQKLPTGFFRFLSKDEIRNMNVLTISTEGSIGYILEVSLAYPERLHDEHSDFPLAPETKYVKDDYLSPYAQRVWKKLHGKQEHDKLPPRAKVAKLLTTLEDKEKYVLHYRNLQLYLELGLELKEIHRVLEFQQDSWMSPYIEYNTEMRQQAKSTFEKAFYKLMNNSVFGKTMENVRKHRNVELCHQQQRLRKLSAKPTYMSHRVFSENLVAVELLRANVVINKPIYVGFSVLDLSKHLMYSFYYQYLKPMYGDKLQLQMTDTDSLLFYCETNDFFNDIEPYLHLFDTSEFPKDHKLYSEQNKKVVGKMKSETNEKTISEFVGLRSKMYAFECEGEIEKRAKGIAKVTVRNDVKMETFKEVLFNETNAYSTMNLIRSHNHQIYCEKVVKTGLSCYDDKRYLLNDGISSLAYGHYRLK